MRATRTFDEIREQGRSISRIDFDTLSRRGEIKTPRVKMDRGKRSAILFGFKERRLVWTKIN